MLARKIYLDPLKKLKKKFLQQKNTLYIARIKIILLVNLICRFEKVSIKKKLKIHPFYTLKKLILSTSQMFDAFVDSSFIEEKNIFKSKKILDKEILHKKIFNLIWNKYNSSQFRQYIDRYKYRIKINKLDIKGKKIIDLGCGNGMFCFALFEMGAKEVCGLDYGASSIKFARSYLRNKYKTKQIKFINKSVYKTGLKKNYFDLVIQNGVFHHLKNEHKALNEVSRILKKDGKLWYYTAGKNDMANTLLDLANAVTAKIPFEFKYKTFTSLNISINKKTHLLDGFTAIYKRETYIDLIKKLALFGFGNFKKLSGGFSTDKDPFMIKQFDYGPERYGEGDLRILCQKLR